MPNSVANAPSHGDLDPKRAELQSAFQATFSKAARSGLLPPGGLTPREQQGHLIQHSFVGPDHLPRLQRLINLHERCIYAHAGTSQQIDEAIALCPELAQLFPEPPPPPARARDWSRVLARFMPCLTAAAIVVLFGLLIWTVSKVAPSAISLPRLQLSAWSANLSAEFGAVSSFAGDWGTPPANPTWVAMPMSNVLGSAGGESSEYRPEIDLSTGIDGWFPNAIDPFQPPLHWTHRLHVYSGVNQYYQFTRGDADAWQTAALSPEASGHPYTATVRVVLRAGQPAAIPSPSADALVTQYATKPSIKGGVQFVKDANDALYAIADVNATFDLHYKLAAATDYAHAPLPDEPFRPVAIALPQNTRADAQRVIASIGQLPAPTYAATVRRLHAYFAGFSVAPIEPGEQRDNEYLTVALARKGVCRHRSRAFFVTATALGVPTRLVENQCHSFCEVQLPNGSWRRLEFRLGNEEGPPGANGADGRGGPFYQPTLSVATAVVATPLAIALLILLLSGHARDAAGHLVLRRPAPRSSLRARRDEKTPHTSRVTAALIAIVHARLARQLGIDPKDDQALSSKMLTASLPRSVSARIANVIRAGLPDNSWDSHQLQRIYWDCYYILRWLDREKQP